MRDRAIILRVVAASLWGLCLLSPASAGVLDLSFGNVAASPGSHVTVPVNLVITGGDVEMSGFDLIIQYDAALLSLTDVKYGNIGSTWVGTPGWGDDPQGEASISGASDPNVLVDAPGIFLNLEFDVNSSASVGSTAYLKFVVGDNTNTYNVLGDDPPVVYYDFVTHDGGISVVPEPSSLLLMGVMVACGLPFLPLRRRRVAKAD